MPRTKRVVDPEIDALSRMISLLHPLDEHARRRVVSYLYDRHAMREIEAELPFPVEAAEAESESEAEDPAEAFATVGE